MPGGGLALVGVKGNISLGDGGAKCGVIPALDPEKVGPKAFQTLNIIDEYGRECLAIHVDRKLNSGNVIDILSDLFILRGVPTFTRSDNGPEFVAQAVKDWIKAAGTRTAQIEPGCPWENGYCKSFDARFRDELLKGEVF